MKAYRRNWYRRKRQLFKDFKPFMFGFTAFVLVIFIVRFAGGANNSNKAMEEKLQYPLLEQSSSEEISRVNQKDAASLLYQLLASELGKPYVYGSEGPDSFDCSGLVKYVYAKVGIELPRVASDQALCGTEVDKSRLCFGDIVFFSPDGNEISHDGIYIGDGYFEHAPKPGDVVKISSLESSYYKSAFKKAVRVLD